jgi:hypothetical protein
MKVHCPSRRDHESCVFFQQIEIGAGYGWVLRVTWFDVVAAAGSVFVAQWALISQLIGWVAELVVVGEVEVSVGPWQA